MSDQATGGGASNPLEALMAAAGADPALMPAFERALLEAELYAVPDSAFVPAGQIGYRTLKPGESLNLRVLELEDGGGQALAAFTDPRRMTAAFDEDPAWISMAGRRLFALHAGPVLINPGDGRGLLLQRDRIDQLLAEAPPVPTEGRKPSGEVRLSPPQQRPTALIARLMTVFAPGMDPTPVVAAWLARAEWPQSGKQGWFLDVRTLKAAGEVRSLVTQALRGLSFGDESLDVTVGPSGGEPGSGLRLI